MLLLEVFLLLSYLFIYLFIYGDGTGAIACMWRSEERELVGVGSLLPMWVLKSLSGHKFNTSTLAGETILLGYLFF